MKNSSENLHFDFDQYLRQFLRSKAARGPLYSALKRERNSLLIDATMGTGKDSLLFIAWGFKVISFERNALVCSALLNAVENLRKGEFSHYADNLEVRQGNCFEFLSQLKQPHQRLVVYYDPMYPKLESERKSALPRKDIQLLRKVVQEDQDIEKNLNIARQFADKTILKRALHSKEWKLPFKCDESFKGKNTRYDIFFHI